MLKQLAKWQLKLNVWVSPLSSHIYAKPQSQKSHVWYSIGMVNPGEQHGNLTGQTEERNQAKRNNHTHMVFTYCIRNFVAFTSKTNLNSKTLSPSGPTIKPANTPSQVFNHPCQILRKHVLLGTQCLATSICFKLLIVDIQKKHCIHVRKTYARKSACLWHQRNTRKKKPHVSGNILSHAHALQHAQTRFQTVKRQP